MVWDFSQLQSAGDAYEVEYASLEDSIIAGTEHHTRYYYRESGDTLLLCGYENNSTHVCYDKPELQLHTPLTYGDRCEGLFHGTAAYGEMFFMRIFGSNVAEVDATGKMILPSGDTLRHVARVHIHREATGIHYPSISTEQQLRTLVDSIPYTTDSIHTHIGNSDRLAVTDTYRWYATGYRYPILEMSAYSRQDGNVIHTKAYYCPPEGQGWLSDREIATEQTAGDMHNDSEVIHNVRAGVSNQTITVSCELTRDTRVTAQVCDLSGIVYRQASGEGHKDTPFSLSVYCGGLHRGQYVLHLKAEGHVFSTTVNL